MAAKDEEESFDDESSSGDEYSTGTSNSMDDVEEDERPLSPPPLSDDSEDETPRSKRKRGPEDLIELARRASHWNHIEHFLDHHEIDINSQVKSMGNWTALMAASREGHHHIVKCLLERGADTNLQDVNGWTACMLAAYKGHGAICDTLCSVGKADALLSDKHRHFRAANWAAKNGHEHVAKFLRGIQRKQAGTKKHTVGQGFRNKHKPPRFKSQKPHKSKYPGHKRNCWCKSLPKPCSRCKEPDKWPHIYTPRLLTYQRSPYE